LGYRTLTGVSRWVTLDHINDVMSGAKMVIGVCPERVRYAMVNSIRGMRNLQATYGDNPTVKASLQVVIDRVGEKHGYPEVK